jgi:uncharacterized protein
MTKGKAIRSGACLVLVYAVIAAAAGAILAEVVVHPGRRPLLSADLEIAEKLSVLKSAALTEVTSEGADGALLKAWNLQPARANNMAVILLHGVGDNRMGMMGYAEIFLRHGYDVLMPDARAHGASGGALATYGLKEADDTRRWVDWLKQHEHPSCIYGFAESMGAAELLQSLRVESRFCAVVAESPFSSFREVGYDRIGQFFGTGAWLGRTLLRPMLETAFLRAKWKYKLDFEQADPAMVVSATRTPVLLIHGVADRNIPVRHSRRIAAMNHNVALWEVPGADHCGAIGVAPEELERRVIEWFETHEHGVAQGTDFPPPH